MLMGDLRHVRTLAANAPVSVAPAQLIYNKTLIGLLYQNH